MQNGRFGGTRELVYDELYIMLLVKKIRWSILY